MPKRKGQKEIKKKNTQSR